MPHSRKVEHELLDLLDIQIAGKGLGTHGRARQAAGRIRRPFCPRYEAVSLLGTKSV